MIISGFLSVLFCLVLICFGLFWFALFTAAHCCSLLSCLYPYIHKITGCYDRHKHQT
ncbi:hypothetical protein NEUTE1DRAFT_95495, partial [Neurospora tetrasperma FGSC 2508]